MEYCLISLHSYFLGETKFTEYDKLIAIGIANGINYLHENKIIHRYFGIE